MAWECRNSCKFKKKCHFFIESYRHSAIFTSDWEFWIHLNTWKWWWIFTSYRTFLLSSEIYSLYLSYGWKLVWVWFYATIYSFFAFKKCKKDCNILIVFLVQGFCINNWNRSDFVMYFSRFLYKLARDCCRQKF